MRPIIQRALTGVSKGPWIPLAYNQSAFNAALYAIISKGAVLTFSAQYTPDDLGVPIIGSVTRVAAVATAIIPNHGLTDGLDSVIVAGSGSNVLDGTFDVASVVDANTITYACANSGPLASAADVKFFPLRVFAVTGMSALSARTAAALTNPASAVRLIITAFTSGSVDFEVLQGMGT